MDMKLNYYIEQQVPARLIDTNELVGHNYSRHIIKLTLEEKVFEKHIVMSPDYTDNQFMKILAIKLKELASEIERRRFL